MLSPTIETERLILRRYKETDIDAIYEIITDERLTYYISYPPFTKEKELECIKKWIEEADTNKKEKWVMELKSTKEIVGNIDVNTINEKNNYCNVGYTIRYAYWGNGYATEAVEALVDYMFCTVGVQRLCARIVTSNLTSVRLATRLNMECDGLLRKGVYLKDKAHDVYVYSITDTDYVRILKSKEQASEESCQQAENEVEE